MKPYYQDDLVTLYHGDFREFDIPMGADAVITDPPYGETSLEWDRWPNGWVEEVSRFSNTLWCFGSFRMFHEHSADFKSWKFSHEIIWKKQNGTGFSTDKFRRVHELATLWYQGAWSEQRHDVPRVAQTSMGDKSSRTKARGEHLGKIGDGAYVDDGTRLQTTVIDANNEQSRAVHPTQKPLKIISPLINYSAPVGGLVVDIFAGSGTTLLAAKLMDRRAIGFEAREKYCEAAAKRLSQQTFYVGDSE